MKSIWIFLLLILSIMFLAGAYYLLPDLNSNGPKVNLVKKSISSQKLDTLALPKLSNATFERIILARDVKPGDTLGFILKDRYKAQK